MAAVEAVAALDAAAFVVAVSVVAALVVSAVEAAAAVEAVEAVEAAAVVVPALTVLALLLFKLCFNFWKFIGEYYGKEVSLQDKCMVPDTIRGQLTSLNGQSRHLSPLKITKSKPRWMSGSFCTPYFLYLLLYTQLSNIPTKPFNIVNTNFRRMLRTFYKAST